MNADNLFLILNVNLFMRN